MIYEEIEFEQQIGKFQNGPLLLMKREEFNRFLALW